MTIEPLQPDTYPPGGISSTVLREIDIRAAVEMLQEPLEGGTWEAEDLAALLAEQGVTDRYLATLASAYVSMVNHGVTGATGKLAEALNKTESTVKGHLWKARRNGLLTGSSGRPGGQLTEEAERLLEGAQ